MVVIHRFSRLSCAAILRNKQDIVGAVSFLSYLGVYMLGEVIGIYAQEFILKILLLSLCRALWRILRAKMENLVG